MISIRLLLGALVATLSMACGAPSHMAPSTLPITANQEMATVVFYRPSNFGGAITSAIFDVTTPETQFFGSVKAKDKIVVQLPPGDYTFMVIGENADFSYASLEPGQIYYMRVQVRMGVWKARFSLNPIHKDMLADQVPEAEKCTLFEKTAESDAWFEDNRESVDDKRHRYFEKWMAKDEADRPHLRATDHP